MAHPLSRWILQSYLSHAGEQHMTDDGRLSTVHLVCRCCWTHF